MLRKGNQKFIIACIASMFCMVANAKASPDDQNKPKYQMTPAESQKASKTAVGTDSSLGDLNHDKQLTIKDLTLMVSYIKNGNTLLDAADINKDGKCNQEDIKLLADMILRASIKEKNEEEIPFNPDPVEEIEE